MRDSTFVFVCVMLVACFLLLMGCDRGLPVTNETVACKEELFFLTGRMPGYVTQCLPRVACGAYGVYGGYIEECVERNTTRVSR